MEEEIKEHIETYVSYTGSLFIPIDTIKLILITKFNKRSLMYGFIASKWFKSYMNLIKILGYGEWDQLTQNLKLNPKNPTVELLIVKYNIDKPKEKKLDLTEEEKKILGL